MNYQSDNLPEVDYFGVKEMGEGERSRFNSWYGAEFERLRNERKQYDLREEMIKYCYDDCGVLASAFARFNESMVSELRSSGVNDIIDHDFTILADFITLPQLVVHWFIGCMMPQRTIAVVPNGGYDGEKGRSLKEHVWLSYLDKVNEHMEGVNFVPIVSRYCSRCTQQRVGSFYMDGYRELPSGGRECFEFYGCYYHGCTICFPDRSKVIRCKHRENGHLTVEKAYVDTMDREEQ